uniref:Helix-turn-helix domain-containing protein n=1 Tax=Schistocephalus solidus TaxID=70667 RepID=A0A0V0J395_SCHSO
MGSPISELLAEIVLQRSKTKISLRYVDDTFVIIKTCNVQQLYQGLNGALLAIEFTREAATRYTLPFLDVSIQRLSDGGHVTGVHQTDSSAEIVLYYAINRHVGHKRSCVRTLSHRTFRFYSSDDLLKNELSYLYQLFRSNGYPMSFNGQLSSTPETNAEPCFLMGIKWHGNVIPYLICNEFLKKIPRQLSYFGISVAHKPASSIRATLCRVEDPIPKEQFSNVIYRPSVLVGHTG